MMPEMDGWETMRYIRDMADIPIIIISAVSSKDEVVHALQIGVDDYLTKPFFGAEVIARIKAVLRRASKPPEITRYVFPHARLMIDLSSQAVEFEDQEIHLTPKEFAVLAALAKQAPSIVGYHDISTAVWGEDSDDAHKRTKYLVYLLRKKFLAVDPICNIILNIDRLGYKLQTEE
jgi:DNA-binding response OmpR family regulator